MRMAHWIGGRGWNRRALALLVAVAFAIGPALPASAAGVEVWLDGRRLDLPVQPQVWEGRTVVPLRAVAEAMGATVVWEPGPQRVTVIRQGQQMALWPGVTLAFAGSNRLNLEVAPRSVDGHLLVPVRFLAEGLGLRVEWDGLRRAVLLYGVQPIYTVVWGDSLWTIARHFGTTVNEVQRLNGLRSDTIYVGQTLFLPAGSGPAGLGGAGSGTATSHPLLTGGFIFPLAEGAGDSAFEDNFGVPRSWSPSGEVVRNHEGVDIAAPKGEPVVAVASGVVVRHGWNVYGGWRVTIALADAPYRAYYAHLSAYAPGYQLGDRVREGQVLGYVGNTGYGPEGTEGSFAPHLHFGLYDADGNAVNPYPFLRAWEGRRLRLPAA